MVGCYKSEKYVPELVTPPAVPWMGCESKHRKEGCLTRHPGCFPEALGMGLPSAASYQKRSRNRRGGGREAARRWGPCATLRTLDWVF